MKKKIVILISFFIILVIIFAPVKLAENLMPENSPLVISGMRGSVWSGEIDSIEIKDWQLQDIDYEISFISLVTGKFGGTGEVHQGDLKGDFFFEIEDSKNIEISDVNIETSAINLEKYIPFPGIELTGKISTRDFNAHINDNKPVYLSGVTRWDNANVDLNGQKWSLGDFDIYWNTDVDTKIITGTISKNKKNKIDIDGKITLTQNGTLEFKGSISQSIDKTIYTALSLFANGRPSNGRLPIKFKKKIL